MSTPTTAELVHRFRAACGLPVGKEPRAIHPARVELHVQLLREEVAEYEYGASLFPDDIADVAQELADIVIVAYGAALDHGIDLDPVIAEVMAANMRKVGPDGTVTKRDDGKILKPPGWMGPDVAGVLARQVDANTAAAAHRWYIDTLRSTTPDSAVLSALGARIDALEAEEGA